MYKERWRIEWESVEGNHYTLKILDKDYTGNSTTLTGGDSPFVTQEDSDSDTFKPVRGQTGYIRIVTDDPSLMESLVPANNTQRQVQVWNTDENLMEWIGFLQADVYTQSWNGGMKEIEIAVNSVLQTLQSVNLRSDMSYGREPLKKLVNLANELIDSSFPVVTSVYNIDNAQQEYNWLTWIVDWQVFFMNQSDEEQSDDAQIINTDTYHYGCSLYEALEKVCRLAGLTLQERGRRWFFTKIDLDQETCRCQYWNVITDTFSNPSSISIKDLLANVEWYGDDNKADYTNGRRMVIVSTDIVSNDEVMKQPEAVPNSTAPYQFNTSDTQSGFRFFAQVCDSSNQQDEAYYNHHYAYRQLDDTIPTTRQDVVDHSTIGTNGTAAAFTDDIRTGVFHIRYYERRKNTDVVYLGNHALVLNSQYVGGPATDWGLPVGNVVYRLKSKSSMSFRGGWLRLNYNVQSFISNLPELETTHLGMFPWEREMMYWLIRVGDYLWNPTNNGWDYIPFETTVDVQTHQIEVFINDGKIVTNKTEDMKVDETDGLFIPIPKEGFNGEVTLRLTDAVILTSMFANLPGSTHLIEGLELTYEQEQSLTYSKKNENRYKKHILNVGFKDNEEVQLAIGTFNNNKQAVNLIRYLDGSYIEGVPYFVDAVNTEALRPELHLLNMLYNHYKEVRRIYTGVLKSRSWLPTERWMYGGRKFLAIISRRNWRTDTDDVKFLET